MERLSSSQAAGAYRPGESLSSPGKLLVFVSLTPETLIFQEDVGFGAPSVPLHVHVAQSERFTVLDGFLEVTVAGVPLRLQRGETLLIPAGTAHSYANGGSDVLRIEVTLSPALDAAAFFETVYSLQGANRLPPRGLADVLALADLCHRHGFYLARVPLALQRPLMAVGAQLARLFRSAYRPVGASPRVRLNETHGPLPSRRSNSPRSQEFTS